MLWRDSLKEDNGMQIDVRLDGNPIGYHGTRAVLRAFRDFCKFQYERTISIRGCTLVEGATYKEKFIDTHYSRHSGSYELDLAVPFDRATAWVLVDLAWSEPGNNWVDEKLDGKPFDLPE